MVEIAGTVIWVEKKDGNVSIKERPIQGCALKAFDMAQSIMKGCQNVLFGQILASDGRVIANFTGQGNFRSESH